MAKPDRKIVWVSSSRRDDLQDLSTSTGVSMTLLANKLIALAKSKSHDEKFLAELLLADSR